VDGVRELIGAGYQHHKASAHPYSAGGNKLVPRKPIASALLQMNLPLPVAMQTSV
jgi:hypothetical protein